MKAHCWNCGKSINYTQDDIYTSENNLNIHQPYIRCSNCNCQIAVVNERNKYKTNKGKISR